MFLGTVKEPPPPKSCPTSTLISALPSRQVRHGTAPPPCQTSKAWLPRAFPNPALSHPLPHIDKRVRNRDCCGYATLLALRNYAVDKNYWQKKGKFVIVMAIRGSHVPRDNQAVCILKIRGFYGSSLGPAIQRFNTIPDQRKENL